MCHSVVVEFFRLVLVKSFLMVKVTAKSHETNMFKLLYEDIKYFVYLNNVCTHRVKCITLPSLAGGWCDNGVMGEREINARRLVACD